MILFSGLTCNNNNNNNNNNNDDDDDDDDRFPKILFPYKL